jgi:hypothetical protein
MRLSVSLASLSFVLLLGLLLLGCNETATVNFRSPELAFSVNAADLGLPADLRDDAQPTIRSIPCDAAMPACPSTSELAVECVGAVCDPGPIDVSVPVGDAVDFDSLRSSLPQPFTRVEEIDIRAIDYTVRLNSLNVAVPPLEIWWAPEGAPSGSMLLGTTRGLAPREAATGSVNIDTTGEASLSDYLVGTSPRVRFYVQTAVDLAPGDPFPEGELSVGVVFSVSAMGPIL